MIIENGGPRQSLDGLVLFAFDDHSLPLRTGLDLKLISHSTPTNRTRIVLGTGAEGTPDSRAAVYYGTVHQVGDEFWMWYLGQDHGDEWFERVCFARSSDGYVWDKPALGLVEYKGGKYNNLVDLNGGSHHVQSCVVYHDPEEDERRFKMLFQTRHFSSRFAAAYSADGLTWTEYPGNPVGPRLEMAGGTRLNGIYFVSGQGLNHPGASRQMANHLSYDFEYWSPAFCIGLRRDQSFRQHWGLNSGEQVHLGASMWNRGNVIVGLYGMWNGHASNDRRLTHMDLGLCVSQDALHFREPIPDFPIVSAAEDGWRELPHGYPIIEKPPALIQGQGCFNIGDETLFWYAPWPEQASDGVRVASWQRDRLGYLCGYLRKGWHEQYSCHCISAPIDLEGRPARLFLNADGLGDRGSVLAEVVGESFEPIAGYEKENAVAVSEGGLHQPLRWQERKVVEAADPIRVCAHIEGTRPEDVRLYALYVEGCTD